MINYYTLEISIPFPSLQFIELFLYYWAVQSILALSLLGKLNKLLDKRVSRTTSEIKSMKKLSKGFALSPVGLLFVLAAIYRN